MCKQEFYKNIGEILTTVLLSSFVQILKYITVVPNEL